MHEPLKNSLTENRFFIYSKMSFKITILGEGPMSKLPFDESVIHLIEETDSFEGLSATIQVLSKTKIPKNHQKIMDVLYEAFDRMYERYSKEFEKLLRSSLGLSLDDPNMLMDVQKGYQLIDRDGTVWQVTEKYLGDSRNDFTVGFTLAHSSNESKMDLYCLWSGALVINLDTTEVATNFYEDPENSSILSGRVIFNTE